MNTNSVVVTFVVTVVRANENRIPRKSANIRPNTHFRLDPEPRVFELDRVFERERGGIASLRFAFFF